MTGLCVPNSLDSGILRTGSPGVPGRARVVDMLGSIRNQPMLIGFRSESERERCRESERERERKREKERERDLAPGTTSRLPDNLLPRTSQLTYGGTSTIGKRPPP